MLCSYKKQPTYLTITYYTFDATDFDFYEVEIGIIFAQPNSSACLFSTTYFGAFKFLVCGSGYVITSTLELPIKS